MDAFRKFWLATLVAVVIAMVLVVVAFHGSARYYAAIGVLGYAALNSICASTALASAPRRSKDEL